MKDFLLGFLVCSLFVGVFYQAVLRLEPNLVLDIKAHGFECDKIIGYRDLKNSTRVYCDNGESYDVKVLPGQTIIQHNWR